MTEADNRGLEADIGITLKKLTAQLAAAEARMVKTAKKGEDAFKRSNPRIEKSFSGVERGTMRVAKSTGGATNSLRQMSLQLSQVAQQGQVTGNYLQALAVQAPDLAIGLGPVGIIAGALAGSLAALGLSLLDTSDAMDKLVDSLTGGEVGLNSARSSISQLRDLQEKYTDAINASAVASGGTASAVAANSKREFEARKQVFEVEVELLKIRAREQERDAQILKDQAEIATRNAIESNSSGIGSRFTPRDGAEFFNSGPRSTSDLLGDKFIEENEKRTLAIKKLNAEIKLTNLAVEESIAVLNGDFQDVDGAASGGAASGTSGGASKTVDRIERIEASVLDLQSAAQSASRDFSNFLGSVVRDSDDAADAISRLANRLLDDLLGQALSPVSNAFGNLFAGALGGAFSGGNTGTLRPQLRSFDGGGFTGMGARSGGVDGKGGFMSVLHPNETVIDHTKGQMMGGITISQSFQINGSGLSAEQVASRLAPMMEAKASQVFARARREGR